MTTMFERAAILGLGLLGGSLARAMKANGLVKSVTGFGRTSERLEFAMRNNVADRVTQDPVEAVRGADFVAVATPAGLIPDMIERVASHLLPGAVVIDMGSTKKDIVTRAERVLPQGVHFVGCHPMAGSERIGVEVSSAILFENALCVVTSSARTEMSALQRVESLWRTLKARVMVMTPEEHDLLVAAASHLPHITAVALCRAIDGMSAENEKVLPLLAGGFRDTTRVASGSPEMWRDILLTNREPVLKVLDRFLQSFQDIRSRVEHSGPQDLIALFTEAKQFRDGIPQRGLGALESEYRVIVDVVDRPGVLGDITGALGRSGINIKNVNIQHVRELGGGALLLVLEKEDEIERAVALLAELGFPAKRG